MVGIADRLRLDAAQTRRRLDPDALSFVTTAEVAPLRGTIGQTRALEAIDFGLEIGSSGYNMFLAGTAGSGRESTVLDYLERVAARRAVPDDIVYVHNFHEPERPQALRLPAGRGRKLRADLDELLRTAQDDIPRAFDGEEFERRRAEALAEVERRREEIGTEMQRAASERGFALQQTPGGIVGVPVADGRPLGPPEIAQLPAGERAELERRAGELNERIGALMRDLRRLSDEAGERTRAVVRETALGVVSPQLDDLREGWATEPGVVALLDAIERDIPEHVEDFRPMEAPPAGAPPLAQLDPLRRERRLARYRVNVLVDHAESAHAPVVVERNPTYYNLVGRVDYRASFGAMETDFEQIRPGALHRADGGFLVLHAPDVLRQPLAWEALKRALLDRAVRIENLAAQASPAPTAMLQPEPVALDVKVVLIGAPEAYHLLYGVDEDFRDLFKVKAEFAPDMDWNEEHIANYAAFVSRCVRSEQLRDFDRNAVARVVEHGARLRDHQGKLSTRLREIADVVTEASFWAGQAGRPVVSSDDVNRAVAQRERRSNLAEEHLKELIADGTIAIETSGEQVGQVNGLAVLDLGDHRFGQPSRVTASVSIGWGDVESIERETELSGPIHSKGFLALSGYLSQTYAQHWPLALRATLTFEQSYRGIDGDSASTTELYALLSALAELPIRQGIAVTGAVDQRGRVHAVGGVTPKVEGFFAVCRARGLTGAQGVVIPRANVQHLMVADEVVAAVAAGDFHIWAVEHVDEGIELLTGHPAGERGADGAYPEGSAHRRVEDRLHDYAIRLRAFSPDGPDGAPRRPAARSV